MSLYDLNTFDTAKNNKEITIICNNNNSNNNMHEVSLNINHSELKTIDTVQTLASPQRGVIYNFWKHFVPVMKQILDTD